MPTKVLPQTHLQRELDRLCRERGVSWRQASLDAGLNETAIRAIMNGDSKNPRGDTLAKLARYFGTTVGELVGSDAPGLAETAPEKYQAMSLLLDSSLMLRITQRYFERLDRDKPNWTARERAFGLMLTYQKLIGRGRVDDSAIKEALDALS